MATIAHHYSIHLLGLGAEATCREAAEMMIENSVGAAAVHEQGQIIGLVTERDLVERIVATGADGAVPLGDVVRRDLPPVGPRISTEECAELMRYHCTRHLLVADGGRVLGIVSMRDVIALMISEREDMIEQLRGYVYG